MQLTCGVMVAQRTLDPLVQVRILAGQPKKCATDPWCNGSTADFGSAGPGSNPGGSAIGREADCLPAVFIRCVLVLPAVIVRLMAY